MYTLYPLLQRHILVLASGHNVLTYAPVVILTFAISSILKSE